jgi:hypothetical protein
VQFGSNSKVQDFRVAQALLVELCFHPLLKEFAMKRNLILFALLSCLSLLLLALNPVQALHHGDSGNEAKAPAEYTSCFDACSKCESTCETTQKYCLKQAGAHKEGAHIKAIQDCIATCKLSKDFMTRGSDLSSSVCALCEQACKRCADSCDTFKDDKTMHACAEECRKCAKSCENMKG